MKQIFQEDNYIAVFFPLLIFIYRENMNGYIKRLFKEVILKWIKIHSFFISGNISAIVAFDLQLQIGFEKYNRTSLIKSPKLIFMDDNPSVILFSNSSPEKLTVLITSAIYTSVLALFQSSHLVEFI